MGGACSKMRSSGSFKFRAIFLAGRPFMAGSSPSMAGSSPSHITRQLMQSGGRGKPFVLIPSVTSTSIPHNEQRARGHDVTETSSSSWTWQRDQLTRHPQPTRPLSFTLRCSSFVDGAGPSRWSSIQILSAVDRLDSTLVPRRS